MPTTNDTVMELEHLQTAITKNADLVPGTERFRVPLEESIQGIRALLGTQKTLIADKQKVTQDLKAAVDAAKTSPATGPVPRGGGAGRASFASTTSPPSTRRPAGRSARS